MGIFDLFKKKKVKRDTKSNKPRKTQTLRGAFDKVANDVNDIGLKIKGNLDKNSKTYALAQSNRDKLNNILKQISALQEIQPKPITIKEIPARTLATSQYSRENSHLESEFKVLINSLTDDEFMMVKILLNEDLKLSYLDISKLTNKSIYAVKKHINNICSKGFPLDLIKENNGRKRYFISSKVKKLVLKTKAR